MIFRAFNKQRKNNIIKNISFLLEENGETKASFSQKTGVTRATLHNILEGKVSRVQQSTILRISDFFGLPCEIIETIDLKYNKALEQDLSCRGNRNPIAVPIIPLSQILHTVHKPIGLLVQEFDTTYYFGDFTNIINIFVDTPSSKQFAIGTQLIVNRSFYISKSESLLFTNKKNTLVLVKNQKSWNDHFKDKPLDEYEYIGIIIEERCCEI